jgi:beta-lactamase regulating signal transducer with metallopeptidase domain/protocatechuate 3,4-dioxygenase beta subunit
MNSLTSLCGALLDTAGLPWVPPLVARWTVLLSLAWVAHAALAGRNPRWKVALWRAVAVGAAAIPVLACAPPVVHWRLPGADRSAILTHVHTSGAPANPGGAIPAWLSHGPAGGESLGIPGLARRPETSSDNLASGAAPYLAPGGPGSGQPASTGGSLTSSRARPGAWVLGLWAAGVMILAARYLWQVRRLGGIIGRSERVADEVVAAWGPLASEPAVHVYRSAEVHAPCLARSWRPVLLLPEHLGSGHDGAEMRAILAHERAHARGHDLAWNDALHLVSAILWFHPLVWRARQAHAAACDAVCDAVAADQLGDVTSYSRALARLALRAAGTLPAGGLAMAKVSDVRRRIELLQRRVFRAPLHRRFTVPATIAFGLCVVVIGGVGFTRAGQDASTNGRATPGPGAQVARQEAAKAKPAAPADAPRGQAATTTLSASGTVVDAAGKPVAGASVILREWSYYRVHAMGPKLTEPVLRGDGLPDILAETKADAAGRFRFENVRAPGFPHVPDILQSDFPWDVVALAPGHGLAWVQLTPNHQHTPITLTLGAEGTLRGRVVEPGGQPVVGAKVKVYGIDPLGRPAGFHAGTDGGLNLSGSSLPLGATTDADGRFTIRGLPREKVVSLGIISPAHQRMAALTATTDAPQPAQGSRPVYTGDFTLTAKRTDHVLTGRIVFEADGKPAVGARVMRYYSDVIAGQDGRYRIEGVTFGPFRVVAMADHCDAAPLDATIQIPEQPLQFEHDLVLPRGLVVTGRVVDFATGRGVDKVTIDFIPKPETGSRRGPLPFTWETDADGRFHFGVPPGRGLVHLRSVPAAFPPPDPSYTVGERSSPPHWTREVEGRAGQTVELSDFRLARSRGVVLRVVDPAGRPVAQARVDLRDSNHSYRDQRGWSRNEPRRTGPDGRYEAVSLQPGQATVIDITAENPPLGATVDVVAEPVGGAVKTIDVPLQPLVSLSGRVLDAEGAPIAHPTLQLHREIAEPGPNGRSYGLGVQARTEVNADGSFTFDRIIPGATYQVFVTAGAYAGIQGDPVKIMPGQPVRLADFRLPMTDREVRGIVVDPHGKPIAGAYVGYQRPDRPILTPPQSPYRWNQDTDASGRFQLTGLPRGPIRLMAYVSLDSPRQDIRTSNSVAVNPGQTEVRIELLQPYGRLRGIE